MQETRKIDVSKIEDKILNIGIELTLLESLINFLRIGLLDCEINMKKSDIVNLAKVIQEKISNIKIDYDNLENSLGI